MLHPLWSADKTFEWKHEEGEEEVEEEEEEGTNSIVVQKKISEAWAKTSRPSDKRACTFENRLRCGAVKRPPPDSLPSPFLPFLCGRVNLSACEDAGKIS